MGAISSAAPWFLTGWTHEVEIEFMIDTGCQVTILSTTVFERMCALDPKVRSELRPCRLLCRSTCRKSRDLTRRWVTLVDNYSGTYCFITDTCFEYRPGAQHAYADGMSRQCG